MSRFFTAGDSSSESGSDEDDVYSEGEAEGNPDEESSSDEEDGSDDDSDSSSDSEGGGKTGVSQFLKDHDSSDESEDEEKVTIVKSAKDKRFEELEAVVKLIENAVRINDWSSISTGQSTLNKAFQGELMPTIRSDFDKLNRQIVKMTAQEKPPKIYVKIISDLEDSMNETIARQKVSAKKMNASNAKGLNAMKQKIKRNNKDYVADLEKYREDRDGYMMSDEEEEVVADEISFADGAEPGDDEGFETVGRGGKTLQYTPESIFKHLRSIVESRGKKNTDRPEQIRIMEKLLDVATTPYQTIRVLLTLISTRFDLTSGSTATFMSQEQWKL